MGDADSLPDERQPGAGAASVAPGATVAKKVRVELGDVQETLLIPLYGRAVESTKRRPILRDPKAVTMVRTIDYDFGRFAGKRSLVGSVLRTALFDVWVRRFLTEHPTGTVVEVGAGLNTRFERLDNGVARWVEIDLPDSMALRRRFFEEDERRRMLAASVLDPSWVEVVRQCPGPYFFAVEAVLIYLPRDQVREALGLVARNFPGCRLAFETASRHMVETQDRHDVLADMAASFRWACDDVRELAEWDLDVRVLDSRTIAEPPPELRRQLPWGYRAWLPVLRKLRPERFDGYPCHLVQLGQ
ncbi:O-Methyltransferase involved in polyketide biosynthesis [Streptoalloteichus tenebrarius]|uniref:O-Methyltransferase involved in polyketide biosynthesis n=1 Tax=Streptoalloteichus tenebrarius (strain ATCC 17920 / DSM 40477 / JCM 4838 / CBS 697.72 / NBRC 16177 / NCIMB 11028 / NRRL B-12390 / A12253. 1 / ISP 5477) TaxID=1933 RepID=A0ABT1I2R4_STRSD|nr:class I SAM-dependent methyltransferase [Streptoalloteichus tenebrarius]MCP2261860.1 O-Methyltransferase involved in polyketide biosynthesis [Streptoalloteichus tenebrarius]